VLDEEETYFRPIYSGSGITVAGAITMIMAFVLRHCLTKMTLDDLLRYFIYFSLGQIFLALDTHLINYLLCVMIRLKNISTVLSVKLNEYLGTVVTQPLCPVCGADLSIESNTGMFLVLPLECQLREMFEHSNVKDAVYYPYNRTKRDSCNIEDMYDGSACSL